MGASASGGMAALLEPVVLESMAGPGSNGRQFEAQLVYGFPAANDHLILTPGLVLALALDSSHLRPPLGGGALRPAGKEPTVGSRPGGGAAGIPSSPAEHSLRLSFSTLF